MEGSCSTGQSPQRAVVAMEEEEEVPAPFAELRNETKSLRE
jgi:hypothetical protein